MTERLHRAVRWFLTDQATGNIVIAQRPNATLSGFLVAKVASLVLAGAIGSAAGWVATGLLVVWAADEVVRGVNPWRRTLGATVVVWQIWTRLA